MTFWLENPDPKPNTICGLKYPGHAEPVMKGGMQCVPEQYFCLQHRLFTHMYTLGVEILLLTYSRLHVLSVAGIQTSNVKAGLYETQNEKSCHVFINVSQSLFSCGEQIIWIWFEEL
uniref:Uncharacterized protein n=1 Tax=Anguilla anguilla TaxID=7936 RepID=A0A0E9X031_ANGAN